MYIFTKFNQVDNISWHIVCISIFKHFHVYREAHSARFYVSNTTVNRYCDLKIAYLDSISNIFLIF